MTLLLLVVLELLACPLLGVENALALLGPPAGAAELDDGDSPTPPIAGATAAAIAV